MNPTTQPSEGAVRAANRIAKEALDRLGTSKVVGTMFHNDIAAEIIDQETGAGELARLLDLIASEAKTGARIGGTNGSTASLARIASWAESALSRHTSTQGKEGKL